MASMKTSASRSGKRSGGGSTEKFVPGGSLLIIHQGEPIFAKRSGWRISTTKAVHGGCTCRIASLTKPHTSTLLAMLVEQGKLSGTTRSTRTCPR